MKTKASASIKKQSVTVQDLKTRKNPKGGGVSVDTSPEVEEQKKKHNYKGIVTLVK